MYTIPVIRKILLFFKKKKKKNYNTLNSAFLLKHKGKLMGCQTSKIWTFENGNSPQGNIFPEWKSHLHPYQYQSNFP